MTYALELSEDEMLLVIVGLQRLKLAEAATVADAVFELMLDQPGPWYELG